MALSAALGFGKALGIAALLTADDFGRYSVLIAIALFLSPLPGLGLIEETRKLFPRMFVDGKIAEMAYRADRIAGVVGLRTAALGLLGAAIFLLAGYELAAVIAASLTLVAFGASWCSIMASALRAGTSPILLGAASFARAALTIPITLLAAHEYGLLGVLAGEALAAVAGGAIMRFAFRWRPQSEPIEQLPVVEAKASRDGMLVFYGTALVSAPIYLSRSVAALSLTAAQVGTLNFLLVFVAIFQTAIAIADQVV
ncbi:MAG TPA: hypothetical protein VGN36_04710, partial [Sphingorhabdus sp.]|nr:hypothetical protein [Sphingorhabdus sp.]